jgi:uridine kinase
VTSSPYLVAISGGSGSGKTTTAAQLVGLLRPLTARIVSQDDYYKDTDKKNKSAGFRLRKGMQLIKKLAQEIRMESLGKADS